MRSPLLHPEWLYIEKPRVKDFTMEDWAILDRQRAPFYGEIQATAVLSMLAAGRDDPTFGYELNHYGHALQTATMLHRDGHGDEDVVVALLHDIGFAACPERHGAFAAELLGAYVSERNLWMLRHHQQIGDVRPQDGEYVALSAPEWDRWRDHPHFSWTLQFVQDYDLVAMDPDYENEPLEFFEPMVRRVFVRPGRSLPSD